MSFGNLSDRVKTGSVLGLVAISLLALSATTCTGRWLLHGFGVLAVGIAAFEFANFSTLTLPSDVRRVRRAILFLIELLPIALSLPLLWVKGCPLSFLSSPPIEPPLVGILFGILAVGVYLAVAGRRSLDEVQSSTMTLLPSLILIGGGGAFLIAIPFFSGGPAMITWGLLVVCANDIAAYFVGSKFGGPKFCEFLSPKKTLSGSAGGFVAGVSVGMIAGTLLGFHDEWPQLLLLSFVVVIASQLGDLAKSYLKRVFGVKDSGTILPGHGGVLDRIDGILAAAPFLAILWS